MNRQTAFVLAVQTAAIMRAMRAPMNTTAATFAVVIAGRIPEASVPLFAVTKAAEDLVEFAERYLGGALTIERPRWLTEAFEALGMVDDIEKLFLLV